MSSPHDRRDKNAERLDDLASSLEAGLPLDLVLRSPSLEGLSGPVAAGDSIVDSIRRRGLVLDEIDWAVLAAAEKVGELPAALRERAANRRIRTELGRELAMRLTYPAILLCGATGVAVLLSQLGTSSIAVPAAIVAWLLLVIAAGAAWLCATRARSDSNFRGRGIPGLAGLLQDLGELPYLRAMAGLTGAGVLLPTAHAEATRTVSIAAVRSSLAELAPALERGEGMAATVHSSDALGAESRTLIESGEPTGQLSNSFGRAAARRHESLLRRQRQWIRILGAVAYVVAASLVAIVVVSGYSGLFAGLRR